MPTQYTTVQTDIRPTHKCACTCTDVICLEGYIGREHCISDPAVVRLSTTLSHTTTSTSPYSLPALLMPLVPTQQRLTTSLIMIDLMPSSRTTTSTGVSTPVHRYRKVTIVRHTVSVKSCSPQSRCNCDDTLQRRHLVACYLTHTAQRHLDLRIISPAPRTENNLSSRSTCSPRQLASEFSNADIPPPAPIFFLTSTPPHCLPSPRQATHC